MANIVHYGSDRQLYYDYCNSHGSYATTCLVIITTTVDDINPALPIIRSLP